MPMTPDNQHPGFAACSDCGHRGLVTEIDTHNANCNVALRKRIEDLETRVAAMEAKNP